MKVLQKVKCFFNRHILYEVERVSVSSQKLYCSSCKKYFAINHDVKAFLPWDSSFDELYKHIDEFNRIQIK